MNKSSIEWTESTWNPIVGCSKVSAGCKNCYAERMANRQVGISKARYNRSSLRYTQVITDGKWNGKTHLLHEMLAVPLKRKKATTYFVCSMSDLFHESVPFEWIDKVFAVMALCPQHTFQILTKRPKRMAEYFRWRNDWNAKPIRTTDRFGGDRCEYGDKLVEAMYDAIEQLNLHRGDYNLIGKTEYLTRNVWLGTTAEDQAMADERIPELLKCPAAKRFVSIEPMLSAVNFRWTPYHHQATSETYRGYLDRKGSVGEYESLKMLDWVICGGESGPGARPMHPDWARGVRDQCKAAGVPFFFKQWGAWRPERSGDVDSPSETRHVMYKADWNEKERQRAVCDPSNPDPTKPLSENMTRVGKKKAGSLLDGVEHKEYPK